MELVDIIKERRSVRTYKETPVDRESLLQVLEAGRLAPSARNEQGWKFVVVQNRDKIEKLFHACNEEGFVREAPVVIAACGTNPDYVMRCGQPAYSIDVSIALTHMMLRATDLGLGTCWLGAFVEKKVREALDIPESVRVVALMTLGHPRFRPQPKSRKPFDEVVCFDRWK